MSKPFKITSPGDPGVRRDPSTGIFISALDKQAPPQVVRESSSRGVNVEKVIEQSRAPYASGTNKPFEPLPKPALPFRVTAGK